MKFKNLQQNIRCPECRLVQNVKDIHRWMNFTFGDIIFFCRCRKKLGEVRFTEWNQMMREYFENPNPEPKIEKSLESRQKNRLGRNRQRPQSSKPRQAQGRVGNRPNNSNNRRPRQTTP